jgi:hypothetical protein
VTTKTNDDQKEILKTKQDQGKGQQNKGKTRKEIILSRNQNNEGKMPKDLENAILDKVSEKEKETARRILNKNSYSMPKATRKIGDEAKLIYILLICIRNYLRTGKSFS